MKLRRRPDSGKWFIDARVNGRRIRESLHTADRKLALVRAKILLNEKTPIPDHEISLEAFKREYIEWSSARKAANTVKAEEWAFKRFLKFVPSSTHVSAITVKQADTFISSVAATPGISPASANFYLRTLKSIFETAKRWGYSVENVFKSVKPLRFELAPARILSIQEIHAFRAKAREHCPHLAPLIEFYLLTGARRAEALSLQWSDVDFKGGTIFFRKTKGKRPRPVLMVPTVRRILLQRTELPQPFPFSNNEVTRNVTAALRLARISGASLHDLRRSFASYLTDAGMPDFFVSALLGHQDRAVTENHYINYFRDMMIKHMRKMEMKLR